MITLIVMTALRIQVLENIDDVTGVAVRQLPISRWKDVTFRADAIRCA